MSALRDPIRYNLITGIGPPRQIYPAGDLDEVLLKPPFLSSVTSRLQIKIGGGGGGRRRRGGAVPAGGAGRGAGAGGGDSEEGSDEPIGRNEPPRPSPGAVQPRPGEDYLNYQLRTLEEHRPSSGGGSTQAIVPFQGGGEHLSERAQRARDLIDLHRLEQVQGELRFAPGVPNLIPGLPEQYEGFGDADVPVLQKYWKFSSPSPPRTTPQLEGPREAKGKEKEVPPREKPKQYAPRATFAPITEADFAFSEERSNRFAPPVEKEKAPEEAPKPPTPTAAVREKRKRPEKAAKSTTKARTSPVQEKPPQAFKERNEKPFVNVALNEHIKKAEELKKRHEEEPARTEYLGEQKFVFNRKRKPEGAYSKKGAKRATTPPVREKEREKEAEPTESSPSFRKVQKGSYRNVTNKEELRRAKELHLKRAEINSIGSRGAFERQLRFQNSAKQIAKRVKEGKEMFAALPQSENQPQVTSSGAVAPPPQQASIQGPIQVAPLKDENPKHLHKIAKVAKHISLALGVQAAEGRAGINITGEAVDEKLRLINNRIKDDPLLKKIVLAQIEKNESLSGKDKLNIAVRLGLVDLPNLYYSRSGKKVSRAKLNKGKRKVKQPKGASIQREGFKGVKRPSGYSKGLKAPDLRAPSGLRHSIQVNKKLRQQRATGKHAGIRQAQRLVATGGKALGEQL